MRTVYIFHGIYGDPEENWIPWLRKSLEERGMRVVVPFFPTTEPLKFSDWWSVFSDLLPSVEEDSIFIGHSLGVAFMLSVLEQKKIAASFCIAPAWGVTGNEFDPIMGDIADRPFKWDVIRENCPSFTIFHAPNDPYLPMERADTLAVNLGTTVTVVPDAGHFNEKAGYTEFDKLLEWVCWSL